MLKNVTLMRTRFAKGNKRGTMDVPPLDPTTKYRAHIEVARLTTGMAFGDMALQTTKPRNATVITIKPSHFITLDRESYTRIMRESQVKRDL